MTIQVLSRLMGIIMVLSMLGCGGGGGAAPGTLGTTVAIKVVSGGVSGQLYGVHFEIDLPDGVTLNTDANGDLAVGVMKASGSAEGSDVESNYVVSTSAASPAKLYVSVFAKRAADLDPGFPVGEFLEISCSVAPGTVLTASALTFTKFIGYDKDGFQIPGVTGTLAPK